MKAPTSVHMIAWNIDPFGITGTISCASDPDAPCRLNCTRDCESWSEPRVQDGRWVHGMADETGEVYEVHLMRQRDYCNAVEWITEVGVADSYNHEGKLHALMSDEVDVWWDGDDWVWGYAP